jgi:hypothetical protein
MTSTTSLSLLAAVLCCGILPAASPTIGIAVTNGNFLLDSSKVVGNANVYEGSVIETQKAMSDLNLTSGLKMRLGSESRGRVFPDRLVLEKGAGQVSGSKYLVEAGRLRVMPSSSTAMARVAFGNRNLIEVAAIGGAVRVVTTEGIRIANIEAGSALSFADEGQGGASTPTTLCGNEVRSNGKLMLTDTTSKITVELKGTGLDQYVGKSISVSGNMAGNDVLQVLGVKRDSCGVNSAKAGVAALSGAAIAGIVIAAATGLGLGLAAATGSFSSPAASQ